MGTQQHLSQDPEYFPTLQTQIPFQDQSSFINQSFQLIIIPVSRDWSEGTYSPASQGQVLDVTRQELASMILRIQLRTFHNWRNFGMRFIMFIRILWIPGPFPVSPGHKVNGMTQLRPRARRQGVPFPAWQQLLIRRDHLFQRLVPPSRQHLGPCVPLDVL